MRTSRRLAVTLAVAAAGAWAVTGIALAGVASNGDNSNIDKFAVSPSKLPKKKFKAASTTFDLSNVYANPGNGNPGGAVHRTQIYVDDDIKFTPSAAAKCNPASISGNIPMSQAMAACGKAKVGSGPVAASANGAFVINGCALLFNGTPQGGKPTLLAFARTQVSNPSNISCADPANNNQGNASVLLQGILNKGSGDFGTLLDFNNIEQASPFPLTKFYAKVKKGNYISAKCHDSNKTLNVKVAWTYNDGTQEIESASQKCKVG
jgi:hypothetical protein